MIERKLLRKYAKVKMIEGYLAVKISSGLEPSPFN